MNILFLSESMKNSGYKVWVNFNKKNIEIKKTTGADN